MRRTLAVMLVTAVCLSVTACSTIPEGMNTSSGGGVASVTTTAAPLPAFALGYIKDDVLNPYTAASAVNRAMAPLLYESLYVLDEGLSPVPQLAASQPTETAADSVVITLRDGARFADGTAVTAKDIEASFALAKAHERYAAALSTVTAVKPSGTQQVTVTLSAPDVAYAARLIFPIVQANTADEPCPVGSGPYRYTAENTLAVNPYAAEKPRMTTVTLKPFTNTDAMRHALGTGQIVLCSDDLADGEIPRITTASATVSTSNLVFMGINGKRDAFSREVRQALNAALDRTELSGAAFAGYADTALSPFHPQWSGATKTLFHEVSNTETAMTLLETAGYRTAESSENRKVLELELLVSSGSQFRVAAAEQIRQAFSAVGVSLTVTKLSYSAYLERLKSGDYDLYLGEVRLTDDLDLAPLFTGHASYGVTGTAGTTYKEYRAGQKTADEFLSVFEQELPFLPLCYRRSLVMYHRQLSEVRFSGFSLFSHVEAWVIGK